MMNTVICLQEFSASEVLSTGQRQWKAIPSATDTFSTGGSHLSHTVVMPDSHLAQIISFSLYSII